MRRLLLACGLLLAMLGFVHAENAAVRETMAKLRDKDIAVRRQAAQDLAEMGPEAKLATAALQKALRDPDLFVRRFAALALGKIGPEVPDAKETVSALALALNDPKKEVQLAAADALLQMGPLALNAFLAAVKDPTRDPASRKKASQGLAKIGPPARGALPILTEMVSTPQKMAKGKAYLNDDDLRLDAAFALGKLAKPSDTAAINALKMVSEGKQKNKALKKAAEMALREIDGMLPKKKSR
ncbi:MAG: HEAT repeat domain-containing protein [Gemmataceae bacterium]